MYVIIMGVGRVGYFVVKMFEEDGYDVMIIEMDWDRVKEFFLMINGLVIEGDVIDMKMLEEVNIKQVDVFVVLMGRDDVNFLVCILVKSFNLNIKIFLRVSNFKNRRIFEEVKDLKKYFDFVIFFEEIVVEYISRNIVIFGFDRVLFLKEGVEIVRFIIDENSKVVGKFVKDFNFLRDVLIVVIYDGKGNLIILFGDIKLLEKGQIIIFVKNFVFKEVKELFEDRKEEFE